MLLPLAIVYLGISINTVFQIPKFDEIVKSHFNSWIPAFAGMT